MSAPASTPEPAPRSGIGPDLWPLVCTDLRADFSDIEAMCRDCMGRHEFGVAKYGKPLRKDNGRDAIVDAYQEALDCAVYLRQALSEGHDVLNEYNLTLRLAVNIHRIIAGRDAFTMEVGS
jgi:hypothetical protein